MFDMSFGELLVIALVAMIVFGPRELPVLLRKAGRFAASMRRKATELRVQSGIDDVLRDANFSADVNELRKLARGEIGSLAGDLRSIGSSVKGQVEGTIASAGIGTATLAAAAADDPERALWLEPQDGAARQLGPGAGAPNDPYAHLYGRPELDPVIVAERQIQRHREYPPAGADDYGAIPDVVDAPMGLPPSPWATDALYTKGVGARLRPPAALTPTVNTAAPDGASDGAALAAPAATSTAMGNDSPDDAAVPVDPPAPTPHADKDVS